jgi:hypothetical protein
VDHSRIQNLEPEIFPTCFRLDLRSCSGAWTFVPVLGERHVTIRGDVAWLDEKLDSEHMGQCRGTGILVYDGDAQAWKIAHYTLSFAVPNDVADAVIDTIAHWNRSKLPK